MEEFIERYQQLVLSTMWLAAGILFAGYTSWYQPMEVMIADLRVAKGRVQTEQNQLKERKKQLESRLTADDKEQAKGINSLPEFLRRINSLAKQNDVIIRKLTVDENDRFKFNIEILIDYLTFLNFASKLEALDVNIHDMQVHPYNQGVTPPIHLIQFAITPRNDARPLAGDRISSLLARVNKKDKRNPFQRFAYDKTAPKVKPEIDLTWVHKLSGIGMDKGSRYATIDRVDNVIGDKINGKKINRIDKDRVYLIKKGKNGEQKFVLKFRRKKKKGRRR